MIVPRPALPVSQPRSRTVAAVVVPLVAVLLVAGLVLTRAQDGSAVTVGGGAAHAAELAAATPVSVTVVVGATPTRSLVGAGLIGLSFDENVLGKPGLTAPDGIATLMRRLGPGTLRVGGTSSQWGRAVPFTLAQLRSLDAVLRLSGWRAILTENDAHWSKAVTVEDAQHVAAVLGPHLAAMACGNEPDLYGDFRWRPRTYGAAQVTADDLACLRTIHATEPALPLVGPDAFSSGWLRAWAPAATPLVSAITVHLYPMAACHVPWRQPATLLGSDAQRLAVADIAPALAVSRATHRPLVLDETNSAACSGIRGVSNAYASALWGADDVLTMAGAGVSGLDFHGSPDPRGCHLYSPICLPSGSSTVRAQPLYDGLLLAHDVGTGSVLPVTEGASPLRVHALRHADGSTGVLLDNESDHPEIVHLVLPRSSGAAAETLMTDAGGPHALAGVVLTRTQVEGGRPGGPTTSYVVRLPPWSAAALVAAPSMAA